MQKRSETLPEAGLLLLQAAPAASVPFRVNDVSRFFFQGVGGWGLRLELSASCPQHVFALQAALQQSGLLPCANTKNLQDCSTGKGPNTLELRL